MRYLSSETILALHSKLIKQSGGASGLRDRGLLESALAQPQASFDGQELHTGVVEKAAALGYSLICNHPFVDGNKRIGHYAMVTFLKQNGFVFKAEVDVQERVVLSVASGKFDRLVFTEWVRQHVVAIRN